MNLRKLLHVSLSIVSIMMLSAVVIRAQEPPPPLNVQPDLTRLTVSDKWSDEDLELFTDLITNEIISVQQTETLLARLTEEQIIKLGKLMGARAGIPSDEVDRLLARRSEPKPPCFIPMYPGPIYAWGCYPAEYGYHYVLTLSHRITNTLSRLIFGFGPIGVMPCQLDIWAYNGPIYPYLGDSLLPQI